MNWPDRRTIGIGLGLVLLVGVAIATSHTFVLTEETTLLAPDGPEVILAEDGKLTDDREVHTFPDNNTVDLHPFGSVASDERTELRIDGLEDEWTTVTELEVTGAELTISLANKQRIAIEGPVETLEYRDMDVDDGQTDFIYGGPSGQGTTTLTVHDLPTDTAVRAVNESSNERIDWDDTGDDGVASFDLTHSTTPVTLQSDSAPSIDELDPDGNLSTPPDELRAHVSDDDFPHDELTVEFYWNDDLIGTETATEAGWVATTESFTVDQGLNDYRVEVTDEYGNERTASTTVGVPETLDIRNETNPDELITSPVNVTITWFGSDEIVDRTTDDGTIDMTGLPLEDMIITVDPDRDYHPRTVYIKSIIEQQSVYLLNQSEDSIETRFVLDDVTGQFDSTAILYIDKPINQSGTISMETIHADEFGVEGVTAILESDQRYNLRVEQNSRTQDLGPYRSDASETVSVQPGAPAIQIEDYAEGWGTGVDIENVGDEESPDWRLFIRYDDPDELTDSVEIAIHERNNPDNSLRANQTYVDSQSIDVQEPLTVAESETEWVVTFVIDRAGEEMTVTEIASRHADAVISLLSNRYRLAFGIVAIFMFGGAFSVLNRGAGAIMTALTGGLLYWVGWLTGATTAAAVLIFLFVAIVYNIYLTGGPPQ